MYQPIYRDQKWPLFCTKCGGLLKEKAMREGFDAFTGEEILESYLLCITLRDDHDKYHIRGEEIPF